MTKKKAETEPFTKFFIEESRNVFDVEDIKSEEQSFSASSQILRMPEITEISESDKISEWKTLRSFFTTGENGGIAGDLHPLHFHPMFFTYDNPVNYPVWMSRHLANMHDDLNGCQPLNQMLSNAFDKIFKDTSEGNMIKRMLPGIITQSNKLLSGTTHDFQEIFDKAIRSYAEKINLRGADKESFENQIALLRSSLPDEGILIPFTRDVVYTILSHLVKCIADKRKYALSQKIKKIITPLQDMLDIEEENDPKSSNPDHIKSSLSFADNYFDFDRFSSFLPGSASEKLPEDRYLRIKNAVLKLRQQQKYLEKDAFIILKKQFLKSQKIKSNGLFKDSEIIEIAKGSLCTGSLEQFNQQAKESVEIIKAIRIGELEVSNKYIPEIHDDFFHAFDTQFFTNEEINFVPPVILLTDATELIDSELNEFTRLLHDENPVNIIGIKNVNTDTSDLPIDPATLAVSQRNAFVAQLTSLNPEAVYGSLVKGLSSGGSSFFQLEVIDPEEEENSFPKLSGSIESRNQPNFIFDGKAGTAWGSRFNIIHNPQIDKDFPQYEYKYTDQDNESELSLPLTYADFIFLKSGMSSNFRTVPRSCWTEDLIELSDFLKLPEEKKYGKVPFIWMVDSKKTLNKVAVSWELTTKTSERLDYWNYLQDSGGINNYHVIKALEVQEERFKKEAELEVEKLKESYQTEIERVRKESTEEAMEHLTSALLDVDTDSILTSPAVKPLEKQEVQVKEDTPTSPENVEEPAPEEPLKEEEDEIAEEPWIETPLCTNCNECTGINNRMFKYNASKQAIIDDPKAGTYAQLVEAAEKCPVKIIHPGKPLDPNEPGLEELIKRASKFN